MNPHRGTKGKPVRVITNSYEVIRRPMKPYYHYDVAINPEVKSPRRAHEIIAKLQLDNPHVFNPRAAYDGKKNLFSRRNSNTGEYQINMSKSPRSAFVIKLTLVATINPSDIDQLIAPGGVQANSSTMAVNLLQIIVRQAANMRHGFAPEARSFFISRSAVDLSGGLEAWHGFFQSVRPVLGRLLINVDVANAAIYKPGRLTGLAMSFLRFHDQRDLERINERDPKWIQFRKFVKGVHVSVSTLRSGKTRPIKDVVLNAGNVTFEKDGIMTTVKDHFQQHHNIAIRFPAMFGVRIGKDAVFPAEICDVIPGQLYRKKLSPEATVTFLKFSTQKPDARLRTIKEAVAGPKQVLDYNTSDFILEAGMEVQQEPISINGRQLRSPDIKYQARTMSIEENMGAWNVVGKQLLTPGTIHAWAFVVFDARAREEVVERFISTLTTCLRKLGLNVPNRPVVERGHPTQVENSLKSAGMKAVAGIQGGRPPTLIVVLLPSNALDIRRRVKHWGDVDNAVATQCVREGKWEGMKDQYCNNVALKINAKIGGINSSIAQPIVPPFSMIIGADVGHPAPGVTNRPSVTSLVASVDVDATRYASFARVQAPRQEIIEHIGEMIASAIYEFVKFWNGAYPKSIVFYRDGVSEGQYAQVAQNEVAVINTTLQNLKCLNRDGTLGPGLAFTAETKPKLVFIVVGKRHHIRFFPVTREVDRSGNCAPGFVVDDQITNATYPDFYLQSHSGIQGTSRPSHYIVIHNEAGLTADQYQGLSFNLCHVYASATRSVSIPAPVYYADRVCARAENHFAEHLQYDDSDIVTTASGKSVPFDLEKWHNGFKPSRLFKQMYFL